jgi:hypothetical protein
MRLGIHKGRLAVDVAATIGLPLPPLSMVAGAAFGGPFDLDGSELQARPNHAR